MPGAGDLKHKLIFGKRESETDEYGNADGAFIGHYPVSAGLRPRFGGEAVTAMRLQGIQPYTVTVRDSVEMREVNTDWQAQHSPDCPCGRTLNELYNIRGITNPDQKNKYLEMVVDSGGASG